MKSLTFLITALLILLVICLSSLSFIINKNFVVAARRPHPQHHETHHYGASEEIHAEMPDHTLPKNKKALECSSCKVLTEEVWTRLHALSKKMNGRPRHSQQVDLIEDMCVDVKREYGLLMRNNKPTLEFSRDEALTRLRGSWINIYLEGRCGKILAQHEEQILERYKKVRDLAEFQAAICQKIDRSCLQEKFIEKKIGSSSNADL